MSLKKNLKHFKKKNVKNVLSIDIYESAKLNCLKKIPVFIIQLRIYF